MVRRTIKCLITRRFWKQDLEYLFANVTPEITFIIPEKYTTQFLVTEASKGVDILLGDVPVAEVLDACRDVRLLQIPWTGVDQVDFRLLSRYTFAVCNSHSNSMSVAELGITLILSCLKQIPSHHQAMQRGNWRRPGASDSVMPELLCGKTIGLIGYGAVGKNLSKMLSGFNVSIIALASTPRKEGNIDILGQDQLDLLCKKSDVLVISVPLTSKTRGMIGYRQFEIMKNSAYIVNISRGDVIDEEAFYTALRECRIAGAGIDAWYFYPPRGESIARPSRFPFETLENVVMSPHRGGMVRGELPHLADVIENLNRFASGQPLINRVDIEREY